MSNFSAKQVHVNFKYYAGNNEYKYLILQEFKYNNIRNEIMFDREKNNVILFLEKIILDEEYIANIIIKEITENKKLLQNYNLDNTSNNNLDNTSNKIYNFDELMYVFKYTINEDKDRLTDYNKIEPKDVQKKFIDYINNKFNPNINKNVTKFLKIYLNKLDETSKIIKIPFSEFYIDNNSLTQYIASQYNNSIDYNILNNKDFFNTTAYGIQKTNLDDKIESMISVASKISDKIESSLTTEDKRKIYLKNIINQIIIDSKEFWGYYYFPLISTGEETINSSKQLFFSSSPDGKLDINLTNLSDSKLTLTNTDNKFKKFDNIINFLSNLKSSIILHQLAFIFYYFKLDNTKEININLNFDIKDIISDPFYNINDKDMKIKKSIMDSNKNLGKNFILEALNSIFFNKSELNIPPSSTNNLFLFDTSFINNKLNELIKNAISDDSTIPEEPTTPKESTTSEEPKTREDLANALIEHFKFTDATKKERTKTPIEILMKEDDNSNIIKINYDIIKSEDYKYIYSFINSSKILTTLKNIQTTLNSVNNETDQSNTNSVKIKFNYDQNKKYSDTDEKKLTSFKANNEFYKIFQIGNLIKKILDWYKKTPLLIKKYYIKNPKSVLLNDIENILKDINFKTIYKDLFFISDSYKGSNRISKYFEKIEENYNKLQIISNTKNQKLYETEKVKEEYEKQIFNYSKISNTDKFKENIVEKYAQYILTNDEYNRLSSSDFISNNNNTSSISSNSSKSKILYDNLVTGNILKLRMIITYYNILYLLKSYILTEGTILYNKIEFYNNGVLVNDYKYIKINNIKPININDEIVNTELRAAFTSSDKITPYFNIDFEILPTESKIQYMININNNYNDYKENKFLEYLKNYKDLKDLKDSKDKDKGESEGESGGEDDGEDGAEGKDMVDGNSVDESEGLNIINNPNKGMEYTWPYNVAYTLNNEKKNKIKEREEEGNDRVRRSSRDSFDSFDSSKYSSKYLLESSKEQEPNLKKPPDKYKFTDLLNNNKNLFRFYDNSLFSKSNKGSSIYFDSNIKYDIYNKLHINLKFFYKKYRSLFKKFKIKTSQDVLMNKDMLNIIMSGYKSTLDKNIDKNIDRQTNENYFNICKILTDIYINKIFFNTNKNTILYYNNKFLEISDVKIYPVSKYSNDSIDDGFTLDDWIKFAKSSQHKINCNNFKYYYEEVSQTTRLAIDNVSSIYKFYIDIYAYFKDNEKDIIPSSQRLTKHFNCIDYANYLDREMNYFTEDWPYRFLAKKLIKLKTKTIRSTNNNVILRGGKIKNKTLRRQGLNKALTYYTKK